MSSYSLVLCFHSNNSDAAALTLMFLRGVRILCQLCTSPLSPTPSTTPTPAHDSIRVRSSTTTASGTQHQQSSSLSPTPQTKSSSFSFPASSQTTAVDVLEVLEPIWNALGSWFVMLAEEVRRTAEEEAACSEFARPQPCATGIAARKWSPVHHMPLILTSCSCTRPGSSPGQAASHTRGRSCHCEQRSSCSATCLPLGEGQEEELPTKPQLGAVDCATNPGTEELLS